MHRTKKTEENNIKTRQKIKKGRSKRCCRLQSTWLIIAPLLHRYRSVVYMLLHRCRTAVTPLSLRCCSVVAPLLHRYHTAIATLSLRYYCSCCRYTVAPAIASNVALLSRRCCTAVAPLSLRCRSAVALLTLLSLCCCCFCSCCHNSVTADISPVVAHGHFIKRQNQGNGFHR